MIELEPNSYNNFKCPECESDKIEVKDIIFQGIHVLADCYCKKCNNKFLHDFPVGHALFYPQIINKNKKELYSNCSPEWFSKPLIESFLNKNYEDVVITKKVFLNKKDVIILNCIDYLYGHVILKLFNAQYYIDKFKDFGLVIIIPKSFEWLIPHGTAEVWLVHIGLGEANKWFVRLNEFIKTEINKYSKVYLSLGLSHPDFTKIDISKFTKVNKFDLSNFSKQEINVTFISREDRLWLKFPRMWLYLSKVFGKLKLLNVLKNFLVYIQNALIEKTFLEIQKSIPNAIFNVVGIGDLGKFKNFINDHRTKKVNREIENKWCRLYAKSQIVIGVHGSNMILPTALSAGVIEILPEYKYGNILQDIASPLTKRELLFLCRFVDEFSKPKQVAGQAVSIIKNYNHFYLTMSSEFLKHSIYNNVNKWRYEAEKRTIY